MSSNLRHVQNGHQQTMVLQQTIYSNQHQLVSRFRRMKMSDTSQLNDESSREIRLSMTAENIKIPSSREDDETEEDEV